MSYAELQHKLSAAEGEVLLAEAAHREAALLASESGTASATTKLDKATTALKAARQSVIDLTAAVEAGAAREAAKVAAAAKAEAEAQDGRVAAGKAELRQQGAVWDEALDSLVAATNNLMAASGRLDSLGSGSRSLDRAQMHAIDLVRWRLRFWTGTHTMNVPSEKITAHLF